MGFTLTKYEPIDIEVTNAYRKRSNSEELGCVKPLEDEPKQMSADDPHFAALVTMELSKRLEQVITEADVPDGDTLTNYRITCAMDALADHLAVEVSDSELTDLIPFGTRAERMALRMEMDAAGQHDMLVANARREKAFRWLVDNSTVTLV